MRQKNLAWPQLSTCKQAYSAATEGLYLLHTMEYDGRDLDIRSQVQLIEKIKTIRDQITEIETSHERHF